MCCSGGRPRRRDEAGGALRFLYQTLPGRAILALLCRPFVSKIVGAYMESALSRRRISRFIRENQLDLRDYLPEHYRSFNAFFTRRIRPDARPIAPDGLIAPCDAKLSAYSIDRDAAFLIKGSRYTVAELLEDTALAREFEGGLCLIFRLTVDDYHRYCYIDSGEKGENQKIPGILHTVQPIALSRCNIYHRNAREYTVMETRQFGRAVQVEVGAMLVGRICNHDGAGAITRGAEKGYFAFGGSTIVLLLRAGAAELDAELLENTQNGWETVVKYGEKIGTACKNQNPGA